MIREVEMINGATRTRLRVSDGGKAGPYLIVLVTDVPKVRAVLDQHRIGYWEAETSISIDGKPPMTVINVHPRHTVLAIQMLVDEIG